MQLFAGDNGIKIIKGFNIFLSNQREPITLEDADGFILVKTDKGMEMQVTFKVETTIEAEVFQVIDESKLAVLISKQVASIANLNFFGGMKVLIPSVAFADGTIGGFRRYDLV